MYVSHEVVDVVDQLSVSFFYCYNITFVNNSSECAALFVQFPLFLIRQFRCLEKYFVGYGVFVHTPYCSNVFLLHIKLVRSNKLFDVFSEDRFLRLNLSNKRLYVREGFSVGAEEAWVCPHGTQVVKRGYRPCADDGQKHRSAAHVVWKLDIYPSLNFFEARGVLVYPASARNVLVHYTFPTGNVSIEVHKVEGLTLAVSADCWVVHIQHSCFTLLDVYPVVAARCPVRRSLVIAQ